jgi:hypothetical protein
VAGRLGSDISVDGWYTPKRPNDDPQPLWEVIPVEDEETAKAKNAATQPGERVIYYNSNEPPDPNSPAGCWTGSIWDIGE